MSDSRKKVLVTGGGRGIGAATCLVLAQEGYDITLTWHSDEASANKIAEKCRDFGSVTSSVQCDLSKKEHVETLCQHIKIQEKPYTHAVLNAAVQGPVAGLSEITWDLASATFNTNIVANMLLTGHLASCMHPGNSIVAVSSTVAQNGGRRMYPYAGSKAALNLFIETAAREAGDHGIRLNGVMPGIIETDQHAADTAETRQRKINSIPLGRLGQPEDVAKTITWLLSDQAAYISGAIIPVHGAR